MFKLTITRSFSKGFNTTKKFRIFLTKLFFIILTLIFLFPCSVYSASPKIMRISISQVIEHPALNETRRGIIDGLSKAGYEEGKNLILDIEFAQGKPDVAMQIAQKFIGSSPTLMVGIGTTSSQALSVLAKKKNIPVVFASVTDPVAAKLVKTLNHPGNLVTGVSNFTPLKPQFELFKKQVPNLKSLGIIYNPGEANSLVMLEKSIQIAKQMGLKIVPSPALKTSEIPLATRNLIGKVEAIFINNDNTALAAFESVVKGAAAGNIPVFSSDTDLIDRGAAAALGPNQYELGLQAANLITKILKGDNPSTIPVEFPLMLVTKVNSKVKN